MCSKLNGIYITVLWFKTKQLADNNNNPEKYIKALLVETIAEEFPRETYELGVITIIIIIIIIMAPLSLWSAVVKR